MKHGKKMSRKDFSNQCIVIVKQPNSEKKLKLFKKSLELAGNSASFASPRLFPKDPPKWAAKRPGAVGGRVASPKEN